MRISKLANILSSALIVEKFFLIAKLWGNPILSRLKHRHFFTAARVDPLPLLGSCKSMDHLRQTHALLICKCLSSDPIVSSKIVAFCCTDDSGDMNYAHHVFETIPEPNVFVWNTMIKGYSRVGNPRNAVFLYSEMLRNSVRPDNYTFPFLLKGFKPDIHLALGKGLHAHICKFGFEFNEFVHRALIHVYFTFGEIDMARDIFVRSAKTDVLTWNIMISGLNRNKKFNKSRRVFKEMEEKQIMPNAVTLVSSLSAFSELNDFEGSKRVHQYVKDCKVESNLILDNALINIYASSRDMVSALEIFERMKRRDVVSWTSIVKGFIESGEVDQARTYFNYMPERDSVSWTAMIGGYVKQNRFKDVLLLFREMQSANVKPDEFTMVGVLTACGNLGALELGEWVEAYVNKNLIKTDLHLENALIDMYFKCGNTERAIATFHRMRKRDKFTWTTMIVGLAVNGDGKKALEMFSDMLRVLETPDDVTYVGVLSACVHTGMVEEGKRHFASMISDHRIEPNVTHFGCMVDLLGRAGRLTEALEVVKNMPMRPNSVVWGALLAACRVHRDTETAEIAASELLRVEPENDAVYSALCSVYAACDEWGKLSELRRRMVEMGIKKTTPGCSLIEINGVVHEFVAGDRSHAQSEEIYSIMQHLIHDLKFAGCVPEMLDLDY